MARRVLPGRRKEGAAVTGSPPGTVAGLRDDAIFKALADRSRRRMLDRLFRRDGQTLGELCEGVSMTRFGVMRHLRVLERAGLIVTRKSGREKLHYLNPMPIR